ncbi:MAG TPA: portal protein [Stellaceae bacterium]
MRGSASPNVSLRATDAHRDPAPRFGERERNETAARIKGAGWESDDDILFEARERFRRCMDWEGEFRSQYSDDTKFVNGDSDNHWQWPASMYADRGDKPSLTVNKTRQHCLQIINDAKQNKPQIRINPVSDEATKASADVYEGVIRHIEYMSNASVAYDTATTHQVHGGIGWWRVGIEYESDKTMEMGCRIQRVRDALSVYLDPDIQEADGSDARFAFVVDDVPRDEFESKYPEYRDRIPQGATTGPVIEGGWLDDDHVRVAEYYRVVEDEDVLHLLQDGSTIRESDLSEDRTFGDLDRMSLRRRSIREKVLQWVKIVGGQIVDRQVEIGTYIPLVRVIGEEEVIEGRLERKGHVRALKDPQRIYNYWASSAVEQVALQSKSPYIAAAESIESFQGYWDTANTENHSVLPYNARDDQGGQLPPPQRQEPPQMAQAYVQGMQAAQQDLMFASGQYQPTMGQRDQQSESSGKALALRQRQGDTATYHYIDNLAIAIRFTGRILLDLIPKIYDTPRIMRILAPDGTVDRVQLDPRTPQALMTMPQPNPNQAQNAGGITPPTPQQALAASVVRIFNPSVGKYEVQADVGPAYATRRQQAFDAFTQIIATAPSIMNVAGDLLMKAADFPMAEELAERLQRLVPPQALGQGPTPQEQQMQQQLQGLQAHIALLSEQLAVEKMKGQAKNERTDIDAYEAVTKRMGALMSMRDTDSPYVDGMEVRTLIMQMVKDALSQVGMAPVSRMAMAEATQDGAVMAGLAGQSPPGAPRPPPGGPPGAVGPMGGPMTQALSPVRPPRVLPTGMPAVPGNNNLGLVR